MAGQMSKHFVFGLDIFNLGHNFGIKNTSKIDVV